MPFNKVQHLLNHCVFSVLTRDRSAQNKAVLDVGPLTWLEVCLDTDNVFLVPYKAHSTRYHHSAACAYDIPHRPANSQ